MNNNQKDRGNAAFTVKNGQCTPFTIIVCGRDRWALECLIAAADKGCTPIDTPGPRWSGYVFNLRRMAVGIETIHEAHAGPFSGSHARYVLRSSVSRGETSEQPGIEAPEPFDDYFGVCTECGRNDGYINLRREHWFTCHLHRVKWCFGDNIFSDWRFENQEIWRRNAEMLAGYREIMPRPPRGAA